MEYIKKSPGLALEAFEGCDSVSRDQQHAAHRVVLVYCSVELLVVEDVWGWSLALCFKVLHDARGWHPHSLARRIFENLAMSLIFEKLNQGPTGRAGGDVRDSRLTSSGPGQENWVPEGGQ